VAKKKTKVGVAQLRRKIEEAKAELARTEGERTSLSTQIEECVEKLREALDCGAGEEKVAMQELRDKIAADEEEIEQALDDVAALSGDA